VLYTGIVDTSDNAGILKLNATDGKAIGDAAIFDVISSFQKI